MRRREKEGKWLGGGIEGGRNDREERGGEGSGSRRGGRGRGKGR